MFDYIKPIDLKAERRRRYLISAFVFILFLSGYLYWQFRNYAEERQARSFFAALQQRNFEEAYRIWQPTSSYKLKDFLEDWGDQGLQGPVERFRIMGSTRRGSGVVVRIRVNDKQNVSLWVERRDMSLTFPP